MKNLFKPLNFGTVISLSVGATLASSTLSLAQVEVEGPNDPVKKFRQLETNLPSPNIYRSASGAPGPAYWQQQADYVINAELDEEDRRIDADLTITYTNNSPDTLNYLWVALDQNRFRDDSTARMSEVSSAAGSRRDRVGAGDNYSFNALRRFQAFEDREYGFNIGSVTNAKGKALPYTINDTMMRIDLPEPLAPDTSMQFSIEWTHNILDEAAIGGRGGYEHFPDSDTTIFFSAQWFPRMAAYTDYTGWQNKQFLGRGEFTLEFGDYEVNLTLPEDHVVSATGVLSNPRDVLTAKQRERLDNANTDEPIFIVTPEEAAENEKTKSKTMKTWRYKAENVRDFAWSSSRKYIWDAMLFEQDGEVPVVTAMSFYPNEAEPIWSQYSTQAVVHTMDVYNKFAFAYPYPTAQSVNSWERGGMEYPMITFNGYRPSTDEDGEITYSRNIKYGLIGVIIHEIGHIYFPMVVNSDERRWTWMDEGLNTFLEYMAEYEWEENFPILGGRANPLDVIPRYMTSSGQVPIMTQSDSVLQFGPNAYSKPASSLVVLRETVMGRELFDHAFKTYATRWKFKRPTPADFFRTMEDASAVDLDWFFRGWYFTTDHVDAGITGLREYTISSENPEVESPLTEEEETKSMPETITEKRNREEGLKTRLQRFDSLEDFYNENDRYTVTNADRNSYKTFVEGMNDWEKASYERAIEAGHYLYFVDFENRGGLITPLPLTVHYTDGSKEEIMIPAEIWRRDSKNVTKLIIRDKRIDSIDLDSAHQTADADFSNNSFPPKTKASRLEIYKSSGGGSNLMQDMMEELRTDEDSDVGDEALDTPKAHNDDDDSTSVPLSSGGDDSASETIRRSKDKAKSKRSYSDATSTSEANDSADEDGKSTDKKRRKSLLERLMEKNGSE